MSKAKDTSEKLASTTAPGQEDLPVSAFEAAVQAEVVKRLAEQQTLFAQKMEEAMKASLAAVDVANASLARQRAVLERELDAANAERLKAEHEGERMAEEYFVKCREAMREFTRKELLRELARDHLDSGRAPEEICKWLQVEPAFVESIAVVVDRVRSLKRPRTQLPNNPCLHFGKSDRDGGTIVFENDETSFEMWCDFRIGPTYVAVIDIPTEQSWPSRTHLPLEQRNDIVQFIAAQVLVREFEASHYEIGDAVITIFR